MRIEEIVRSCCADERVANAAVASIGRGFLAEVSTRALSYDMSVGAFTALSVERFVRHGDEGELRSVVAAMNGSQEPILAGLHRILCIMLAAGGSAGDERRHSRVPRVCAQLYAMESPAFRDLGA